MKNKWPLFYLSMAGLLYGCNEKISPELLNSSSTTVAPPTTSNEYYFRVVNSSPAILNYALHKTGLGNATTPCEIKQTGTPATPLSNARFINENSTMDISCFFEAEELALYFNGMNFSVEASPNTCEYVGYSPYSFYDWMPGSSGGSYEEVLCMTDETSPGEVTNAYTNNKVLDTTGAPLPQPTYGAGVPISCGQMVDKSLRRPSDGVVDASLRQARGTDGKSTDQDLCVFDYRDQGGPNCDEGVIQILGHEITYVPDNPDTPMPLNERDWKVETTERMHFCGGKAVNCVAGPIKKLTQTRSAFTQVKLTTKDQAYSEEFEFESLYEKDRASTREYANWRRNLANLETNFTSVAYSTYSPAAFTTSITTFNTTLLDMYSNNKTMNNAKIIDTASEMYKTKTIERGFTAAPLAAEPYLGVGNNYKVSPFYTFYCLDRARDIKARIRMVVRDWDRVFPTTSSELELISDIADQSTARQDIADGTVELPGDNDDFNNMNDYKDWDDIITMARTNVVPYAPATHVWWPTINGDQVLDSSGTYDTYDANTFFNTTWFPQGTY